MANNKLHKMICRECHEYSGHLRLYARKENIFCKKCNKTTPHEKMKKVFCVECDIERTILFDDGEELYCPICVRGTRHVEKMKKYKCDACGLIIEHKEDSCNIITDCPTCDNLSNFIKQEENVSKKRKNKHRGQMNYRFYCQECNQENDFEGSYKHTITLFRICKTCGKQTEFKKDPIDFEVPEDLIRQHFKIFPLKKEKTEDKEEIISV